MSLICFASMYMKQARFWRASRVVVSLISYQASKQAIQGYRGISYVLFWILVLFFLIPSWSLVLFFLIPRDPNSYDPDLLTKSGLQVVS